MCVTGYKSVGEVCTSQSRAGGGIGKKSHHIFGLAQVVPPPKFKTLLAGTALSLTYAPASGSRASG
jgi:hypothetical protein